MMILSEWHTAHESAIEPGVIIVCKAERVGDSYGGRVQVVRAGHVTYDQPRRSERAARELFERVVDAHERGEALPV